jgi:2-oxoisovalerate dehydrogenase E2 component (dihydrolipoyl transacylase)
VFTDKLVAKIPSTPDGVIKSIKYQNDEICPVGKALIEIEVEEAGSVSTPEPPVKETKKAVESSSSSSSEETGTVGRTKLSAAINSSNEKVLATPAVRSIAKRNSIDLKQVPATGKDGRVMKEDILAFIEAGSKPQASPAKAEACSAKLSSAGEKVIKMAPLTGVKPEDEVRKLTGMKKAMTKTMTESRSIPFFMFSDEIEVTQLLILRRALKQQHKNLTMLPFFVKAASIAMTEYPIMNSNFNPETDEDGYIKEYVIKKDQNFSIAIDSKDGLTVPNIKRVQDKSIL